MSSVQDDSLPEIGSYLLNLLLLLVDQFQHNLVPMLFDIILWSRQII